MHCLRELYGHEMLTRDHKRTARAANLPSSVRGRSVNFPLSPISGCVMLEFHVYRVLKRVSRPV